MRFQEFSGKSWYLEPAKKGPWSQIALKLFFFYALLIKIDHFWGPVFLRIFLGIGIGIAWHGMALARMAWRHGMVWYGIGMVIGFDFTTRTAAGYLAIRAPLA